MFKKIVSSIMRPLIAMIVRVNERLTGQILEVKQTVMSNDSEIDKIQERLETIETHVEHYQMEMDHLRMEMDHQLFELRRRFDALTDGEPSESQEQSIEDAIAETLTDLGGEVDVEAEDAIGALDTFLDNATTNGIIFTNGAVVPEGMPVGDTTETLAKASVNPAPKTIEIQDSELKPQ